MIGWILDGIAIGIFCWVVYAYTAAFIKTSGSVKDRIWAAAKESATILWSQAVILAVGALDAAQVVGNMLDAGFGDKIVSALPANYTAAALMVIMAITVLARLRSLGKS